MSHGMDAAVALLRKRGFEVHEPFSASAARAAAVAARPATRTPRAPRATSTRTPRSTPSRSAVVDDAPAICPTCFMALPATGICDNCG